MKSLTEIEVSRIARREALKVVNEKRAHLLTEGGFLTLDGPISFEEQGPDQRATVNGVDVNTFLNLHLTKGQTVKLVVIQVG